MQTPKKHDSAYGAMILVHKDTNRRFCVAMVHNTEYIGDTVYYAAPLKDSPHWAVTEDTIDSIAAGGDKYSRRELEHYFYMPTNE